MAEPALVGRERELEEIIRCLNSAAEGKGTTVFVSGEAGSGKTRLAHEFLKIANRRKIPILPGLCLSDAAVPYLPFVEAFNSYFGSLSYEEESANLQKPDAPAGPIETSTLPAIESGITTWLIGQRPTASRGKAQAMSPQIWQDQVFDGVTKTLHEISIQQPIVLFIEDIHWADSASLALLHYVARNAKNSERILILATFRSEELTADAKGHTHSLTETLRSMKREDLFIEIRLPNLNQTDINKIAGEMIGGKLQREFAAKLVGESRGNPLFVVESLRMLSERKSLVKENEEWRLAADEMGIPSKVRDIILRRLNLLKPEQKRVLDAASVIGERFDVELLGTVLGLDNLEVLETLDAVARSTSLVNVDGSSFRFDHARSRETLYEELSLPLKKGYHSRIAERLEATGKGRNLPLSDIAFHYAQAGKEEKAVEYALAAGQDALAKFSNAEAIKHFKYVLEKKIDDSKNSMDTITALEGLGDAYYANCLYKKALEVFERLAGLETGEARLRAFRKAMDATMFGQIPDWTQHLVELATEAEPYAASSRLESARIRFLGATALMFSDHRKELEEFEATLQVFEEEYSLPDVARALVPIARSYRLYPMATNKYGRGLGAFLRSIAMYEEMGDPRGLLEALSFAGESFLRYGVLLHEAKDKLTRAVQLGEKMGSYDKIAAARINLGAIAERMGFLEEALAQSQKALEYSALTDTNYIEQLALLILARQYAKVGDLKRSEAILGKIEETRESLSMSAVITPMGRELWFLWAQVVLSAAKNSWKKADEYFQKAIKMAETRGTINGEIGLRKDYAWALEKQGRTEEAKIQLERRDRIIDDAEKAFAHVTLEASLMVPRLVTANEEFEMRLDLVNLSKKQGSLVRAEDIVPRGFTIAVESVTGNLQDDTIQFDGRSIEPFQVVTAKVRLKAPKLGDFILSPTVTYLDDLGETKTSKLAPLTITVRPSQPKYKVFPNRISTGVAELDGMLFGGIPQRSAVALASPSTDEKELLVKEFLDAGATAGEITFHITAEAANTSELAERYPSNFYLFLCNPQADTMIQSEANVFKLKGFENLTEIDIALTKAFRTLDASATVHRRICVEIVSDVLLQHHVINTRRWLSSLLPTLKSKGFTTLAVIDPQMHPQEEARAILGLFDGEIQVTERETSKGDEKVLRITRLAGQKYLEDEMVLKKGT